MDKYYKVIKDNFLWEVGAILKWEAHVEQNDGYAPIEDVWNKYKGEDEDEYVSEHIVENSPEYFERVYPSKGDKMLFVTAEVLKKAYESFKK